MAGIVTLPYAQQTGLGRLGDVIYASAAEGGHNRRADEREARLRAQRLADVESDRGYARTEGDRLYSRGRGDRLSDVESDRGYVDEREGRLHARDREEKLSDLDEARDWQMLGAAMERDLRNNPEGVQQAQLRLNQLANDEAGIVKRMTAREQALGASEPQPNPQEVENLAMQRARASIPKAGMFGSQRTQPTREEIAAQIPGVIEEVRAQTNAAWQRARLDNQEQQRIDAVLLQRNGAEKNTIMNVFRRVGIAGGDAPAPTAGGLRDVSVAPPGAAAPVGPPTLQQAQQNFRAGLAPPPPPAARGAGGNWGPTSQQTAPPPASASATNPYLADVTPAVEQLSASGTLLRSPGDVKRARNTDYVEDFARRTGQFFSNLMPVGHTGNETNPRGWQTADNNPQMRTRQIQQLQARLAAIDEPGTPLEAQIRFELDRLLRMGDQQSTAVARRLAEPVSSVMESTPAAARQGNSVGFFDPGF